MNTRKVNRIKYMIPGFPYSSALGLEVQALIAVLGKNHISWNAHVLSMAVYEKCEVVFLGK
jgi:hypothetical protein